MSKADLQAKIEQVQSDISKELGQAYDKLNVQIARIMGPELKKCIDKYPNDSVKMTNCYDDFKKKIDATLAKITTRSAENTSTLQKCLQSKENAQICAKVGLTKTNQYLAEAFNDLKSYLA